MKYVVLWETNFPFVDTVELTKAQLSELGGRGDRVVFWDTARCQRELLHLSEVVLVTPYGSAFPKAFWQTLRAYLEQGGRWINLGGAPVNRPVRRNAEGAWQVEVEQTAYMKDLMIRQAFPIEATEGEGYTWAGEWEKLVLETPKVQRSWSLQVRFSDMKDFPREHGTGGSREATLETLLYGVKDERPLSAPLITIDRLRGDFAGGRWVLLNAHLADAPSDILLREIGAHAAQGVVELDLRPSFATYYEGEQPAITVRMKGQHSHGKGTLTLTLSDASGTNLRTVRQAVELAKIPSYYTVSLTNLRRLSPGLYRVSGVLKVPSIGLHKEMETGFWVYDEVLLLSGKPFTTDRDYFIRDGQPFPILGTTYMSGDRHRKFLFEPNPIVWDHDFAKMKRYGINMVRTGLWTAWKRAMLDPGAVDEGVLRAFTAFLLCARKYDIPITFNFFAFWPEEWGGVNPYLDPRAISAQQELVTAFAHRFANVPDLSWDFINEPSATSPERVWSTRPNYDSFEQKAWAEWIRAKYPNTDLLEEWSERWRTTTDEGLGLPSLADFNDGHIFQGTHPLKSLTFRLFMQDVFTEWTRKMVEAVRSNGSPHQLVTVGQDEGGIWDRPNVHFFGEAVDFTTNHTWWQNDDLLWDSVITKTPDKPNVSQETGIMFVENIDGRYRRTPEIAHQLLGRKLALAFVGGCAGAIEWLWNTNIYMDSDNEVGIGLHRADGTEKPEIEAMQGVAHFVNANKAHFVGRRLEEVCLVIPHSNVFGARPYGDMVTRKMVRAFESDLWVGTRAVSEYRADEIVDAKLIVVPSARILNQEAWEHILECVREGATLLVSGTIDWDEYYRPMDRLSALDSNITTQTLPVSRYEHWSDGKGNTHRVAFGGEKIQRLEKAELLVSGKSTQDLLTLKVGKGTLVYSRLPLECAEGDTEAILPLYQFACEVAGITTHPRDPKYPTTETIRITEFADSTLYIGINEGSEPTTSHLKQGKHTVEISLGVGYVALAFVDHKTGEVLASYPPNSVKVS